MVFGLKKIKYVRCILKLWIKKSLNIQLCFELQSAHSTWKIIYALLKSFMSRFNYLYSLSVVKSCLIFYLFCSQQDIFLVLGNKYLSLGSMASNRSWSKEYFLQLFWTGFICSLTQKRLVHHDGQRSYEWRECHIRKYQQGQKNKYGNTSPCAENELMLKKG